TDPSSKAVYVTSNDEGATWQTKTKDLYDDFVYGVQDPCLNQLSDGTIFTTFFMWKVFKKNDLTELLPSDRILEDNFVARKDDSYSIRSYDGGETWDVPIPINYTEKKHIAVRGNIVVLDDGSIVLPVYGENNIGELSKVIIIKSDDLGKNWEKLSEIPQVDGYGYFEPNLYKTKSGKLVAFIRTHKVGDKSVYEPNSVKLSPLVTSESIDNGKTWSQPILREVYSPSPFHPLRLESGNVILTYGYRYRPYGLRAIILDAECTEFNKDNEVVLRVDGLGTDIGYTSSVLLDNGDILITYYYYEEDGYRYIAGTICREV
ncbi:MAG: exo-alpha-sialidase, partial [Clostridiales bacterium]|nr:exo-alpha-sialidase [Clostridiales bacterium]